MRDIRDYTVGELIELGAQVDVWFHDKPEKEQAKKIVEGFGGLNKAEDDSLDENIGSYNATESSKGLISVTAFYDK